MQREKTKPSNDYKYLGARVEEDFYERLLAATIRENTDISKLLRALTSRWLSRVESRKTTRAA